MIHPSRDIVISSLFFFFFFYISMWLPLILIPWCVTMVKSTPGNRWISHLSFHNVSNPFPYSLLCGFFHGLYPQWDKLFLFCRDPFAAQRQQMRSLFGSFGYEPFPLSPQIQPPRAPHLQVCVCVRMRERVSLLWVSLVSVCDVGFNSISNLGSTLQFKFSSMSKHWNLNWITFELTN